MYVYLSTYRNIMYTNVSYKNKIRVSYAYSRVREWCEGNIYVTFYICKYHIYKCIIQKQNTGILCVFSSQRRELICICNFLHVYIS